MLPCNTESTTYAVLSPWTRPTINLGRVDDLAVCGLELGKDVVASIAKVDVTGVGDWTSSRADWCQRG